MRQREVVQRVVDRLEARHSFRSLKAQLGGKQEIGHPGKRGRHGDPLCEQLHLLFREHEEWQNEQEVDRKVGVDHRRDERNGQLPVEIQVPAVLSKRSQPIAPSVDGHELDVEQEEEHEVDSGPAAVGQAPTWKRSRP